MGFFDFLRRKKKEAPKEVPKAVETAQTPKVSSQSLDKKPSLWSRIKGLFGKGTLTEEALEELEELLITADVGPQVTEEIITKLEKELPSTYDFATLVNLLKQQISRELLDIHKPMALPIHKPQVIVFVGANGVGKTTSIGKLAYSYTKQGKNVVLGAGDTFRAAAPQQLTMWATRTGAKIVSRGMHKDPSSVAYDAIQQAQVEGDDIVLVDTAGRLHNKIPLMNQLGKIERIIQKLDPTAPHEVLLVIDGTTGQNGWQQVALFKEAIGVTGLVVTKLDSLAKGGMIVGLTTHFKIPVRYVGFGEQKEDLKVFDVKDFIERFFEGSGATV